MNCKKCGTCCRSTENQERIVIIYPSDLLRISLFLKISKEEFVRRYCDKDYIDSDNGRIDIYILKNINYHCIFLNDNNLCEIYIERPIQCQKAPYAYFAYDDIWEHMECFEYEKIKMYDSSESDRCLARELLNGYFI